MNSASNGFLMIRSIDIKNFRCYESLHIDDCKRINVIVGDNGTGKTALLEAIFLGLGASTELAMRLRQQRGLDGIFNASQRVIENAIFSDYFYKNDTSNPIVIALDGDGQDNRTLTISRGRSEAFLPFQKGAANTIPTAEEIVTSPFTFAWRDAHGEERKASPSIMASGMQFPTTGEELPDFFMIPSTAMISSVEIAGRFSELSKAGKQKKFIQIFTKVYNWIDDIAVEVTAGSPALYVKLKDSKHKIPLANLSSGINRIVGILLIIAARSHSVVLIDEIESGIYYAHQKQFWRNLLDFAREYQSQLFITTHSKETLEALVSVLGKRTMDVALWRHERNKDGSIKPLQFTGETLVAGIEHKVEVRSSSADD
jgi:predicted ATPase